MLKIKPSLIIKWLMKYSLRSNFRIIKYFSATKLLNLYKTKFSIFSEQASFVTTYLLYLIFQNKTKAFSLKK